MTARCVVALAIWAVAALSAIACSGEAYTAACSITGECNGPPDAGCKTGSEKIEKRVA
jgi:hypothetical protein